jgi:hypothetical protein
MKIVKKIAKFAKGNVVEILFLLGMSLISLATFLIHIIAGIYIVGIMLIIISFILLKPKGGD